MWVIALILMAIGLSLEHLVPGISRLIGAAGGAVILTMIAKHRYWQFRWFWITFALLVILQVPLMILIKPLMDYLKFFFMWLVAIIDFAAMGLVIEVVASRFDAD